MVLAALSRGWEVEWWLKRENPENMGYKAYQMVREEDLPDASPHAPAIRWYERKQEILPLIRRHGVGFLVVTDDLTRYLDAPPSGFQTVHLQIAIDTLHNATRDGVDWCDLFCFYTPHWFEWLSRRFEHLGASSQADFRARTESKFRYLGPPQFDLFDAMDRGAARRKLGIPEGRPVALFFPYPLDPKVNTMSWDRFFDSEGFREQLSALWRGFKREGPEFLTQYGTWPFRRFNHARLVESLRAFCDKNDALLVAKSREKSPFTPQIKALADFAFYDEDYYPATALELAAIADVTFHPASTGALEFAAAGTYGLCMIRPYLFRKPRLVNDHFHFSPQVLCDKYLYSDETGGIYNFEGVTRTMEPEEIITQLPDMSLEQFTLDPGARSAYKKHYIDPGEGSSSVRVVRAMESL